MAVFGPKDKDVPILTQIYQLEIPEAEDYSAFEYPFYHTDLDKWAGKFKRGEDGRPLEYWSDCLAQPLSLPVSADANSPQIAALSEEEKFSQLWWQESNRHHEKFSLNSDIRMHFANLLPIIALVKRIMQSVYETKHINESDAEEFRENARTFYPTPNYVWQSDNEGRVSLDNFQLMHFSPTINGFEWQVLAALEKALSEAKRKEYDYFRKCTVCENIFIAEHRSDQVNCSRRCNDRLAARNYYEKHPRRKKLDRDLIST